MKAVKAVIWVTAIMAGIYFIDSALGLNLNQYGVRPREVDSLWFVLTSPFLHGHLGHLLSNLIGLAIFTFILFQKGERYFFSSSLFIIIFSGLFVWAIARPGIHIGASGLIFGMWSLIIFRAFFERKFIYIVIATLVVIFQGGMVWGLLPTSPWISFEAHIGGAIGGFLYAYLFHSKPKSDES